MYILDVHLEQTSVSFANEDLQNETKQNKKKKKNKEKKKGPTDSCIWSGKSQPWDFPVEEPRPSRQELLVTDADADKTPWQEQSKWQMF